MCQTAQQLLESGCFTAGGNQQFQGAIPSRYLRLGCVNRYSFDCVLQCTTSRAPPLPTYGLIASFDVRVEILIYLGWCVSYGFRR